MRRTGLLLAGLILMAVSFAGAVHGVRAGAAQALYFRCKYGSLPENRPEAIPAAAALALALYPQNYFLCILVAELAYYGRFDADGRERPEQIALAEVWCRRGLELNPYRSQLRMLDMRLTERRSLKEALRKWEAYVDWQYWDPYNHVVLVELYGQAGRYPEALAALAVLLGTEYYPQGRAALRAAWEEDRRSAAYWAGRQVEPGQH